MSASLPLLIAGVSAVALSCVAFATSGLVRQVRLRRHLNRLRTLPVDGD